MAEGSGGSPEFVHKVTQVAGERAGLRPINQRDPVDLARMWEIEQTEGMRQWVSGGSFARKTELVRFVRRLNNQKNSHLYAITAQDETIDPRERGEVNGWIRTDETQGEKARYERIMGCTLPKNGPQPVELAYIKRLDGPKHLASSAIRQVCLNYLREDSQKEGFVEEIPGIEGKTDTQIKPKRIIMLFIDKDNTRSIQAAEEACFRKVKNEVSWMVGDEPRDDMYVLDWDLLEKTEEKLNNKSTISSFFPQTADNLKPELVKDREYTHRVTYNIGERAGLRRVQPKDPKDLKRMFEIEKSPGMTQYIAEEEDVSQTPEQLTRWINEKNDATLTQFYGVTAQDEHLPPNERGEVEGWIRLDSSDSRKGSEERKRYQRLIGATLPNNFPSPAEVTYIKRPGAPPKLMASAIRQLCLRLASQDAEVPHYYYPEDQKTANNQDVKPKPKRIVMAFSEPENPASIQVLLESGFDLVREHVSWDPDWDPTHNMYVLNWDKLQQIEQALTQERTLDRLRSFFPEGKARIIPDRTSPPDIPKTKK